VGIMFADRIKELRKEKGYTQISLAEVLSVSKGTLSMWEMGERTPHHAMLVRLADMFDCTVDYLLGNANKKKLELAPNEAEDSAQMVVLKDYESIFYTFATLDDEGQKRVADLVHAEFRRCVTEGTIKKDKGIEISAHRTVEKMTNIERLPNFPDSKLKR